MQAHIKGVAVEHLASSREANVAQQHNVPDVKLALYVIFKDKADLASQPKVNAIKNSPPLSCDVVSADNPHGRFKVNLSFSFCMPSDHGYGRPPAQVLLTLCPCPSSSLNCYSHSFPVSDTILSDISRSHASLLQHFINLVLNTHNHNAFYSQAVQQSNIAHSRLQQCFVGCYNSRNHNHEGFITMSLNVGRCLPEELNELCEICSGQCSSIRLDLIGFAISTAGTCCCRCGIGKRRRQIVG
mmetsp:Transcript_22600/g.49470  ORF Transcript_22600/g.49470 Transcript_22600/m.49470 type:complete len:242 (+) Transcript_22600:778-1503(+)